MNITKDKIKTGENNLFKSKIKPLIKDIRAFPNSNIYFTIVANVYFTNL